MDTRKEAQRLLENDHDADFAIHSDQEFNPWWAVEFSQFVLLDEVCIWARPNWASRFMRYAYETSIDGKTWTQNRIVLDGPPDPLSPDNSIVWHPKMKSPIKWLRIRLLEKGIMNLKKATIYGRIIGTQPPSSINIKRRSKRLSF